MKLISYEVKEAKRWMKLK